ncbi:FadR family transcriptional regulator [Roseospira marina]|uniref:FadR family transcriptional regulator n=1 Tax=Roseospira marina TaxID=140057 RepID=A0A5M6IDG0_9PROT|nr:FadR/GntR family transcriptional regulator [Roseospira marina]KAA5605987.1 FadR family transcriptional regulator [Roseospira marina]MBB4313161.1 DNA-binding FadR family transcriptional regulator [Roseospira marina]MBB5086098.1 DNA-binding FadR family transcriptional regulator [Roseospira marina]
MSRRATLSDQIYDEMVGRIISGQFTVGQRLPSEADLCSSYAVSRTVVREVLFRLREKGYVVSRRGAGSFVQRPTGASAPPTFGPVSSIADLNRCFEFRISMEGEAAFLAAERRDATTLPTLRQAHLSFRDAVAMESTGGEEDMAFHLAVAAAARNQFFGGMLRSIEVHVLFGINLSRNLAPAFAEEHLTRSVEEHARVLDAIQAGDSTTARATMRAHLMNARHRIFGSGAAA